jgi:hypothetical protein
MRKTLTLFVCAAALLMMFTTACKKDSKSPQELIMGKWNLSTYEWKEVYMGVPDGEVEDRSGDGDYIDFRSDGKVYMDMEGSMDTVSYEVLSAKHIKLDGDSIELSSLSEKKLSLYWKYTAPDYTTETWYNFVK